MDHYGRLSCSILVNARKVRGRKPEFAVGIPEKLTMRDCVGKVAEI